MFVLFEKSNMLDNEGITSGNVCLETEVEESIYIQTNSSTTLETRKLSFDFQNISIWALGLTFKVTDQ